MKDVSITFGEPYKMHEKIGEPLKMHLKPILHEPLPA